MGTRSTIAIEQPDGKIQWVYCHWDGYPEHNGKILMEHYSDPEVLQRLINEGAMSTLNVEIGYQHPFDTYKTEYEELCKNWCTFYHRDRGEPLKIHKHWNFATYKATFQHEEYAYILRQNEGRPVWWMKDHDREWVKLTYVIDALDA